MRFEFIKAEKANYPVWLLCKVMQVSKQAFYRWLAAPVSRRNQENKEILEQIRKVHTSSRKTYGRRRIVATLCARGEKCSENRVRRIMKRAGIHAVSHPRFKRTTTPSRVPPAQNLLAMDFTAYGPNQIWVSDITYIATHEGWVYLCTVLDAWSRAIIGWSMSSSLQSNLVINALESAFKTRQPEAGLIVHSDRGSQYGSAAVRKLIKEKGALQSMSGKGNCFDNAMAESFFASLKKELVHLCDFRTRQEAKTAVFEFIEVFYNRIRVHSGLGFLSPLSYENRK